MAGVGHGTGLLVHRGALGGGERGVDGEDVVGLSVARPMACRVKQRLGEVLKLHTEGFQTIPNAGIKWLYYGIYVHTF